LQPERPEPRFRVLLARKTPVFAIFAANNPAKRPYKQSGWIIGIIKHHTDILALAPHRIYHDQHMNRYFTTTTTATTYM